MRIYFDENISPHAVEGLAALQKRLELSDHLSLELKSIPQEFQHGVADEDWIPAIAKANDCAVTHDINIKRRRQQLELLERHGLNIIFVKRPSKKSAYWDTVMQLVKAWPEVRRQVGDALETGERFQLEVQANGRVRELR